MVGTSDVLAGSDDQFLALTSTEGARKEGRFTAANTGFDGSRDQDRTDVGWYVE